MKNQKSDQNLLEQEISQELANAEKIAKQVIAKKNRANSLKEELDKAKKIKVSSVVHKYQNHATTVTWKDIEEFNIKTDKLLLDIIEEVFQKNKTVHSPKQTYFHSKIEEYSTDFEVIKNLKINTFLSIEEIIILCYDLILTERSGSGPLYNSDFKKSKILNLGYINHPDLGLASIRLERKRLNHSEGEAREYHLHFYSETRRYYAGNEFLVK
ncbi:hypothetical protein K8Q94_01945 [Candidatus Nomurabacteria bacterium]|nr:hypothetical protein [Candidatus Nomurabacteria bacterium]